MVCGNRQGELYGSTEEKKTSDTNKSKTET